MWRLLIEILKEKPVNSLCLLNLQEMGLFHVTECSDRRWRALITSLTKVPDGLMARRSDGDFDTENEETKGEGVNIRPSFIGPSELFSIFHLLDFVL